MMKVMLTAIEIFSLVFQYHLVCDCSIGFFKQQF